MGLTNETVGISCGGLLDSRRGIIQSPPNLPNWNNIEIVKYLRRHYGINSYLENDVNACAIAEWFFGRKRKQEYGLSYLWNRDGR